MDTLSRKELRRPDDFIALAQRVWSYVQAHAERVALIGVGAFVVVAIFIVWGHFSDGRQGAATALLGQVLDKQAKSIVATPSDADGGVKSGDFRSAQERCTVVLAELDKLDKEYSGSDAAQTGGVVRASCLLDAGRDDEAQKAYRAYLADASTDDPIRFLAYEGLGYALERKGKVQEAIAEFRGMGQEEGSPYRDRAMWHEARMLERLGKRKEASELYRQILEKFSTTTLRDEISTRVGAIQDAR